MALVDPRSSVFPSSVGRRTRPPLPPPSVSVLHGTSGGERELGHRHHLDLPAAQFGRTASSPSSVPAGSSSATAHRSARSRRGVRSGAGSSVAAARLDLPRPLQWSSSGPSIASLPPVSRCRCGESGTGRPIPAFRQVDIPVRVTRGAAGTGPISHDVRRVYLIRHAIPANAPRHLPGSLPDPAVAGGAGYRRRRCRAVPGGPQHLPLPPARFSQLSVSRRWPRGSVPTGVILLPGPPRPPPGSGVGPRRSR